MTRRAAEIVARVLQSLAKFNESMSAISAPLSPAAPSPWVGSISPRGKEPAGLSTEHSYRAVEEERALEPRDEEACAGGASAQHLAHTLRG